MALLAWAGVGCSTTATIRRASGPAIEGRIVGSDRDSLHIRGEFDTYRLDRAAVGTVDHPGDIHLVVGGALAVLAGSLAAVLRHEQGAWPVIAVGYGLPAVGLLGYGGYNYVSSRRASACFFAGGADDSCPGSSR